MKLKKMLLTLTAAAVLAVSIPFAAMAVNGGETALPAGDETVFVPGSIPAETGAVESMTPALHAGLLTLLHLGDDALTSDAGRWETVYNMLSLYGQLDERADSGDGLLTVPAETVLDFSAALPGGPVDLNTLPEELADRMTYLADQDSFRVVCGDDNLAEIRLDRSSVERDKLACRQPVRLSDRGADPGLRADKLAQKPRVPRRRPPPRGRRIFLLL